MKKTKSKASSKPKKTPVKTAKKAENKQAAADRIRTKLALPAPKQELSSSFIDAAKKCDERINDRIAVVGKTMTQLAADIAEFKNYHYEKALGLTWDEWVDQKSELGLKSSQVYEYLKIHKALVENGNIPQAEVDKMSVSRASGLASLPEAARTPKLIEAAQTLTDRKFKEVTDRIKQKSGKLRASPKGEIVEPEGKPVFQIGPYFVEKDTQEDWDRAFQVAIFTCKDSDKSKNETEKAIGAFAAEMLAGHLGDYEEFKRQEAEAEPQALPF